MFVFAFVLQLLPLLPLALAAKCALRLNQQQQQPQVPLVTPGAPDPSQPPPANPSLPAPTPFDYSNTKVRGVNLCVDWYLPWLHSSFSLTPLTRLNH
jgi:hypothetical protein